MPDHDGFTTHLRPKARVRDSHDEDLAVIDDRQVIQAWLFDSHHAVCVGCSHRVRLTVLASDVAAAMKAHREGCGAR